MQGKVGKQIKHEQKVGSTSVALTKTRKGSADVAWIIKKKRIRKDSSRTLSQLTILENALSGRGLHCQGASVFSFKYMSLECTLSGAQKTSVVLMLIFCACV